MRYTPQTYIVTFLYNLYNRVTPIFIMIARFAPKV